MRPSDIMWENYKRLYKGKLTGVLGEEELEKLIVQIADLTANGYKIGKVSEQDAIDTEEAIPEVNWFKKHKHVDLNVAAATARQTNSMAGIKASEKNITVSEKQKEYIKTTNERKLAS